MTTDLVIYYENSSFFWTLSGFMKLSASMGFSFRVSACPGATCLAQLDYSIMALNAMMSLFIKVSQVWARGFSI